MWIVLWKNIYINCFNQWMDNQWKMNDEKTIINYYSILIKDAKRLMIKDYNAG